MVRLKRYQNNPILKPRRECVWEEYVYNSAAIFLDGKFHLLYRALARDKISRIGYAQSNNGFTIVKRLKNPVFVPETEAEKSKIKHNNSGVEDPRMTKIDNKIYMTYTAANGIINQVSIAFIDVEDFLNEIWNWQRIGTIFPGKKDKDAVLLPEKMKGNYVLYHRLKPDIFVSYSKNLKNWSRPKVFMKPRENMWDSFKIGAAAPPIKIDGNWLFIYHGVEKTAKGNIYRLGYVIVDGKNPEKILYRSKEPILWPQKSYEKNGQVANVVFSCGLAAKDNKLFLYYGGADSVLCVATAKVSDFLKS